MLKYRGNKNRKANDSVITRIDKFIDMVPAIEAVQPYLTEPVEDLMKYGALKYKKHAFYVNGPIEFKTDDNLNFIGPKEYPLHFKKADNGDSDVRAQTKVENVDLSGGVTPGAKIIDIGLGRNAKTLNVSGWNTSNSKSLLGTFMSYVNLKCLDLSTWDLTKVESADNAFAFMQSLEKIIFNKTGLPSLTKANSMFYYSGNTGCCLDLSYIKTGVIRKADRMLSYTLFSEIDLRGGTFSPNCSFTNFAYGCYSLKKFNGVKLDINGLPKELKTTRNWTDVCVDIIKNPEKYEQYLEK